MACVSWVGEVSVSYNIRLLDIQDLDTAACFIGLGFQLLIRACTVFPYLEL